MNNDSLERLMNLHQSLMVLRYGDEFSTHSRSLKLRQILRFCAEKLCVARVSVWSMSANGDRIECEALYVRDEQEYQEGMVLYAEDYPAYFEAMQDDRIINADDACNDARTREFCESYLKPLGIASMLDAPIFSVGALSGVLCVEHVGQPRHWDVADISYAAAVADTISNINEHELWERARAQTEFLEQYDSLTGLMNRYVFQQIVDRDISEKPKGPHALVLVGLDGFAHINDQYGQQQADQLLASLGMRFQVLAHREQCLAARLVGDVFAFWWRDLYSEEHLTDLIDNLREEIEAPVRTEEGNLIQVGASYGVFNFPYKGEGMPPDPLRAAEITLQTAKRQGRGSVVYFSSRWYEALQDKQKQSEELHAAFELGQLVAYYQPIVGQEDGAHHGLEALVRWVHPEKGVLSPAIFIPLLQELGLLKQLGDLMLAQACKDARKLLDAGCALAWVSVNLSAEHLYSDTLIDDVKKLLDQYQLPGHMLELEIVEEVIGRDSELVLSQLKGLSALGVGLSIDDFGTGYSSLSRLKHLPVNKLKVDKTFVDGLPDSIDDCTITRSIVGLGKAMQLKLVAEGVETLEQANWLREHQIEYLQGYLFAKPMALDAVCDFFSQKD